MTIDAVFPEYQTVNINRLVPSPTNPRKTFDPKALEELAESIRAVGLLQPILARPRPAAGSEEDLEIVTGERRWRAAALAGRVEVDVRIKKLTDAEVIEAQVTENLIRSDVHPLEEMNGILALMQLDPERYTVQELSAKFGKSQSFIARRLKLAELIPEAAEALRKDEIGIGHAEELAVLGPDDQKDALAHAFTTLYSGGKQSKVLVSVANLRRYIETNILLLLDEAPFDTRDESLYPEAGSCLNCPFRTGYNALLFPDMKEDSCTRKECYSEKITRHIDASGLPKIAGDWAPVPEGSGILPRQTFTILNPQQADELCQHATEAILGTGPDRGGKRTVCLSENCPIHSDDPIVGRGTGKSGSPSKAEIERSRLKAKIDAQVQDETAKEYRRAIRSQINAVPDDRDIELLTYMVSLACEESAEQFLEEWGVDISNLSYGVAANLLLNHLSTVKPEARTAVLFDMMLVTYCGLDSRDLVESETAAKVAQLYKIDVEEIGKRVRRRVEAEHRAPRKPKEVDTKPQGQIKSKTQGKEVPAIRPVTSGHTRKPKGTQKSKNATATRSKKTVKIQPAKGKAAKSAGKESRKSKTATARA